MVDSKKLSVVIFAKEKPFLKQSLLHIQKYTVDITVFKGERTDAFPKKAYDIYPDITLSYMSPWIIPNEILQATKKWSINFHPGPPEYPGIGCTNFALYNEEKEYGVTAHLMNEKVDTGKIIAVERFPIVADETVYSLTQKCYKHICSLFLKIVDQMILEDSLSFCGERWLRKPYTRKELDALCEIRCDMDKQEVNRRIRATYYPDMPGPYIEVFGNIFKYKKEGKEIS